ncbi:MAG TPA: hypothetical protein VJR05_03435 [Acidimicrobiia bacterium]|nr:hypothetical protein [Acidimicrobiia bacterium]
MTVEELVPRLRSGDPTIWGPPDLPELANRLGWLRLPETMAPEVGRLEALAKTLVEGVDQVVLLGMGGSSLAPEVFAATFPPQAGYPRLQVLDSTHPEAVSATRMAIDLGRSLFVVSSKSGTTLETLSGFRYFWEETGGDGSHFVAITDPGTPLEQLAVERGFRAVVSAPSDVGGRFSALTPFGLLPAALVGIDIAALLEEAERVDWEESVRLGLQWGQFAQDGINKLTIHTSPGLRAYPDWVEQLVAESLGKDGRGILPVVGEPPLDRYSLDRLFLEIRGLGQPVAASPAGHPVIRREVDQPEQLAKEMMAAEIATAVAGEVLSVHPFNQPDVEAAKRHARQALESEPARVDLTDTFSPVLADQLDDLLAMMIDGGYLAIHAYFPRVEEEAALLAQLRHKIGNRAGLPTTLGYGPRFLHSTGQFHKGGPGNGVFLQLVDEPERDLPVPETATTFGRLIAAQALGDYLALRDRGRRVLRVDLGGRRTQGLDALLEAVG